MKCSSCPLFNSSKPCPSSDWAAYCRHTEREKGEGYWTTKLLREADQPIRKLNPCDPDTPLTGRPRPSGLKHELVVARYREDTAWVNDCSISVSLYEKCPGWNPITYGDHVIERHLPNLGREAGTYLTHIVENYDSLADWTYFVQGNTHSGVELFGRLAVPYQDTCSLTAHYKPDWPGLHVTKHDLVEEQGGYPVRYGLADLHGDRTAAANAAWLALVWKTWFTGKQPKDWYYGYGAEIAVPRHRITDRPLAFWKRALEAVLASPNEGSYWASDPYSCWAFELIWRYLFADAKKYKTKNPKKVTVFQMARNLAQATVKQVAAGYPIASETVQNERKAICEACPLLDKVKDRCTSCGCVAMNLKRSWLTSQCPENKW